MGPLLIAATLALAQSGEGLSPAPAPAPRGPREIKVFAILPDAPPSALAPPPVTELPPPPPGSQAEPVLSPPSSAGGHPTAAQGPETPPPEPASPAPVQFTAPLLPPPPAKPAEAAPAPAPAPTPGSDRWFLMRALQGTWPGVALDDNRMYLSGWVTGSFTASTNSVTNQPVVWNDRANQFLLQQAWVRIGRSVLTNKTDPTFGFQADFLIGSDYRFTLPRGLLNAQLENSTGAQNLYGVDPIQHYVNAYVPNLFRGTEFRFGRLYTPWGVESLESVSTPLISRSYAFNWSPPFTHCGAGAYVTFTPVWSAVFMAVNGNDVYFGDPAEEARFVGNVKWAPPGGKDTVVLATSLGRGKFNAGAPFAPATIGLANEPLGRNNFNAFDVVWTHAFNSSFSYNMEGIYGYQTNVPGLLNAAGGGTAHWLSLAHYLFYTVSPRVTAILRYENFDDFEGQRTGFEGLYTAVTTGLVFRIRKDVILRWEARYDYNGESKPFEGKHDIFTSAVDLTLRW